MRILFLSNFYPPFEIGGYEQWAQEVATGLIDKGHEILVLTSRHGISTGEQLIEKGVRRTLFLQSGLNYYNPADFFLRVPFQEFSNKSEIKKAINEFQPEVTLVWGMWNLSLNLPYLAEKLIPGRVAYYIASYWPEDVDPHRKYWKLPTNRSVTKPLKSLLRAVAENKLDKYPPKLALQHAVCCSEFVRDTLVSSGSLPESAGVLYGGVDTQIFSSLSSSNGKHIGRPLQLLYFGRLVEQKGVATAIEALGILRERGIQDQLALTIVGSGHPGYEAKLKSMVEKLGIGDQVRFCGWIPRDELPKLLQKFDIYLFTSVWPEPMARSVMEAMASGLLVIGSEVGGQTEMLVDGQNALTFKPNDALGLSDQLIKIIEHPSLREKLALAGNELVKKRFTLDRMIKEIEDYLQEIACQNNSK